MRAQRVLHAALRTALAWLPLALPSCGSEAVHDPNSREISWTYGPTDGTARPEHLAATGKKGGAAIAEGWKCRLVDGKRLTVQPYRLAPSHAMFGKATLMVGLFDKTGKQLAIVNSAAITAENASFSFDLSDAVAPQLYDVVIWFGAV